MKRYISILIINLLLFATVAKADEGMWLINLIGQMNIEKLHEKGLELTAEQIYSINNASLKDAVVALDHGSCTGEFVSPQGLILTNHHCAHDNIQKISSLEKDYLTNGYWASNYSEEIPIEGKTISLLIRVEEITDLVEKEMEADKKTGKSESFRSRRVYGKIEKAKSKESGYQAWVSSMFGGNKYYVFYYEVFKDVRLVGAPPLSIGNYGAETDNWQWPQHKGDFAFYRVYTAPDGKPAAYSEDNVPYQPKKHLPISLKGVEEGDYAMTLGYPYSIDRFMTSYGVEELLEILNPAQIAVREKKLSIMKEAMENDHKVMIQYSSKFFNSMNYYQYAVGENKYSKEYDVISIKRKIEKDFTDWYKAKKSREKKYGAVLSTIKESYAAKANYENTEKYYQEAFVKGCDLSTFALRGKGWESVLKKGDEKAIAKKIKISKKTTTNFFKDYDYETDKKLFASGLKLYAENVDPNHIAQSLKELIAKYNKDYDAIAEYLYSSSCFSSEENFEGFMNAPSLEKIANDPVYNIIQPTVDIIYDLRKEFKPYNAIIKEQDKLFIEGLLEMNKGKDLYPDANSTMRLSYGTVGGYSPRDGVTYDYYTSIDGYLEKENAESSEFVVDPNFKKLVLSKDFGQYADSNGQLPVDFLTNNDITGGNSGSPVINGKGELIGVAFDGNWESMSGGIYYHPYFNKTVCVDIRFVLFVVDKYANAQNIMNEITIIK